MIKLTANLKLSKKSQILASALICVLIFYFIVEYAVSYLVLSSIRGAIDEDLRNKIKLENISFKPLSLELEIKNIDLSRNISLSVFYVDINFSNLIKRQINISDIVIKGLNWNIAEVVSNFQVGGAGYVNKGSGNSNWLAKIDDIRIVDSQITLSKDHEIKLEKIEIHNLYLVERDNLTKFNVEASVNKSDIIISGQASASPYGINGHMIYSLSDFDLDILNSLIGSKISNIGKIKGELSSEGSVKINNSQVNVGLNLDLQNLFIYSKNMKIINYFAKEILVDDAKIFYDKTSTNVKTSSFNISNLLLSVPLDKFKEGELSKFSKIKIDDISISKDKKTATQSGIINFTDGGFVAANNYDSQKQRILDIKARDVDLTQFSESLRGLLNSHIKSGKLSIDTKISSDNEKIKGNVVVNLYQLNLDNKNEFGKKIKRESLIPIKTAISMIKDDNGNIGLNFNISGSKDDPDFDMLNMLGDGIGSVVISKISSIVATKMAAKFTPILLSSIPLSPGNVFLFANGAYKIAVKPRFNDMEFDLLKSNLTTKSEEESQKFVSFLKKNKEMKFQICPVVSIRESDNNKKISHQEALLLAEERISFLKEYFKDKMNGDLGQVIFCRPQTSDTNSNIGKAIISL